MTERERLDRIVDDLVRELSDFKKRRWGQSTDLNTMAEFNVPGEHDARDAVYRHDIMASCLRAGLSAARESDQFMLVLGEMLVEHFGGTSHGLTAAFRRFIGPTAEGER